MVRNFLLIAVIVAVGLVAPSMAKDGEEDGPQITLEQLLDAAREEIDQAQAVRDAVAADPANMVGIDVGGALIAIDRRDVAAGVTLAASLVHEVVSHSPTAEAAVIDLIGATVGSSLENVGLNAGLASFIGSLAGQAAQAMDLNQNILTEDRLQREIASRVEDRLDSAALDLSQLDTEIAIRWEIYDAIEAAITARDTQDSEIDQPGDKPPGAGSASASAVTAGGWSVELGAVLEDRTDGLVVQPYGDGLTAYFEAPAAYLGDWRGRSQITFERMSEGGEYYGAFDWGGDGDVVIMNGVLRASYVIDSDHSGGWGSFTVPLDGSGWTFDGGSFDDILADVTEFRIRAEYGAGADISGLRNVVLD